MVNNFKNPWDVGGEHYNQNALHTQFLPEGFLETKQSYQEWKAEREQGKDETDGDLSQKYANGIKRGNIVYTCNAGWIDRTHAFTKSNRATVGADNLWKQIVQEKGTKSGYENGFKVTYTQDAKVFKINIGTTKSYFVKYGLSKSQKEQVALSIFQEVSMEFERQQAWGALIGRGDSSFEPADLVSNLLGFYNAVRPELTISKIMELCKPLTSAQSLDIYKQYPGTFTEEKYKNKKFTPLFFPNKYCKNSKFPKEFQQISTIKKGTLFRDWDNLFDIHESKPPMPRIKY